MPLAGPQLILIARNVVAAAFERFDRFAFDGDDIKGSKAHNFAARRGGAPILQVSESVPFNSKNWGRGETQMLQFTAAASGKCVKLVPFFTKPSAGV